LRVSEDKVKVSGNDGVKDRVDGMNEGGREIKLNAVSYDIC